MKKWRISLWIFLLMPSFSRGEIPAEPLLESGAEGWQALPRARPFPSLLSDPRDLRTGLRLNRSRELEADVGAYRSLIGWRESGRNFHAGIEGGAFFVMAKEGSKFPLHSSDGLIGAYAEASSGLWHGQLRYTHISAHLSDGLNGRRTAILYTREFVQLRLARDTGSWRPYLGLQLLTHTAPRLPALSAQLGAFGILDAEWAGIHPYFGADLKLRNPREGSTAQISAGGAFLSGQGGPPVRLLLSYLKGHDLRGQFHEEKADRWAIGLELDP